jgi:hypothetical protein
LRSMPTNLPALAAGLPDSRRFILRIAYCRLLTTAMTTGRFSWAAVHSAWAEYMIEPSPTMHRTGMSGRASFTPSAAGTPQPRPPPRVK